MSKKYDKVNNLYEYNTNVQFETMHDEAVNKIVTKLKQFKIAAYTNHPDDFVLHENVHNYVTIIRKIVTTLHRYEFYLQENLENIINILTEIGKYHSKQYLVKDYGEPIFDYAKQLYKRQGNYYIEKIEELLDKYEKERILIITRQKDLCTIEVKGQELSVSHYKNVKQYLTEKDVFIFIGSPELFGEKFKTVFLANQYIFIAFDIFNNTLIPKNLFTNKSLIIQTIFDSVTLEEGIEGENASDILEQVKEPQQATARIESRIAEMEQSNEFLKFKAKFVRFANNSWMLIPLDQYVHCFYLEEGIIKKEKGKKLGIGDFIIFRKQRERDIIVERANMKLGDKHKIYRKNLNVWKRRLSSSVETMGYERVSNVLIKKGISSGRPINIKNWISPQSIEPRCLKELLPLLKFDEEQVNKLVKEAKKINAAHRAAGREIRNELMEELKASTALHQDIQEQGFYKFESVTFEGYSFNIEEIRFISEKEYEVPLSYTMTLFRKGK